MASSRKQPVRTKSTAGTAKSSAREDEDRPKQKVPTERLAERVRDHVHELARSTAFARAIVELENARLDIRNSLAVQVSEALQIALDGAGTELPRRVGRLLRYLDETEPNIDWLFVLEDAFSVVPDTSVLALHLTFRVMFEAAARLGLHGKARMRNLAKIISSTSGAEIDAAAPRALLVRVSEPPGDSPSLDHAMRGFVEEFRETHRTAARAIDDASVRFALRHAIPPDPHRVAELLQSLPFESGEYCTRALPAELAFDDIAALFCRVDTIAGLEDRRGNYGRVEGIDGELAAIGKRSYRRAAEKAPAGRDGNHSWLEDIVLAGRWAPFVDERLTRNAVRVLLDAPELQATELGAWSVYHVERPLRDGDLRPGELGKIVREMTLEEGRGLLDERATLAQPRETLVVLAFVWAGSTRALRTGRVHKKPPRRDFFEAHMLPINRAFESRRPQT